MKTILIGLCATLADLLRNRASLQLEILGEKADKWRPSCSPRVILVDEGSKGQLSDTIEKITIRQGQVGQGGRNRAYAEPGWMVIPSWVAVG